MIKQIFRPINESVKEVCMHVPVHTHTHPCTHMHAHTHLPQFFKKLVRYCESAFFFSFVPFLTGQTFGFLLSLCSIPSFSTAWSKGSQWLAQSQCVLPLTEGHHSYKGFFSFPLFSCASVKNMFYWERSVYFIIFKYLQYFIRTKQQRGSWGWGISGDSTNWIFRFLVCDT